MKSSSASATAPPSPSSPPSHGSPPRHCPACAADLSPHPYYRRIPSGPARRLHLAAKLSLPLMTLVFSVAFAAGEVPLFYSGASGYAILGFICLPATVLVAIATIFPSDFRVICLRCSWFRDFAFRLEPLEAEGKGSGA